MNFMAAARREEKSLEKEIGVLQGRLDALRKFLANGSGASRTTRGSYKRSAATRRKMALAAKKRWAARKVKQVKTVQ